MGGFSVLRVACAWPVGGARGVRFESVYAGGMVGEAKHCFVGGVGGGEVSPGVPGGGSVSVVTDGSAVGCVAGDEYGKAHVGRVDGVSACSVSLLSACVIGCVSWRMRGLAAG